MHKLDVLFREAMRAGDFPVSEPVYPEAPSTFPTTSTLPNYVSDEGGLLKVYQARYVKNGERETHAKSPDGSPYHLRPDSPNYP